jgi:hypothetical protein
MLLRVQRPFEHGGVVHNKSLTPLVPPGQAIECRVVVTVHRDDV